MFNGALTALVTPFRDGEVDAPALRDLIEWQIQSGIDGLVHAARPENPPRSRTPNTTT